MNIEDIKINQVVKVVKLQIGLINNYRKSFLWHTWKIISIMPIDDDIYEVTVKIDGEVVAFRHDELEIVPVVTTISSGSSDAYNIVMTTPTVVVATPAKESTI